MITSFIIHDPSRPKSDMTNEIATIARGPEFRPPAVFAPDPAAAKRFLEFFTANIRNPNTRRAY